MFTCKRLVVPMATLYLRETVSEWPVVYSDLDGVMSRFEDDPLARVHMKESGFFRKVPAMPGLREVYEQINQECELVVLTKIIERPGVVAEKIDWLKRNFGPKAYSRAIFVPYTRRKSEFIDRSRPSLIIDDGEKNLVDCTEACKMKIYFSERQTSRAFPTARKPEEIYALYKMFMMTDFLPAKSRHS